MGREVVMAEGFGFRETPAGTTLAAGADALGAARDAVARARAHGYGFALLRMTPDAKAALEASGALAGLAGDGVAASFRWTDDAVRAGCGDPAAAVVLLRWVEDPFGAAAAAAKAPTAGGVGSRARKAGGDGVAPPGPGARKARTTPAPRRGGASGGTGATLAAKRPAGKGKAPAGSVAEASSAAPAAAP